jgi:polysaccharide chain length determinant protein (PEP-CTERM system associated)
VIPGKKYKPEDFLEIAWRRKWYILVPLVAIGLGTFVWAQMQPNIYESSATVLIVPPRVPETYVREAVTATLNERIVALQARLLSRSNLERIIEEFNLYPEARKSLFMEDVVARMRNDISVDVNKPRGRKAEPNSFLVGYRSRQPRLAQQVADRLASLFVNANSEDRELQAGSTSTFLQSQLDDTRKRLLEQQQKIEEYQRSHSGELPNQVNSNLQVMQSTQSQLQHLNEQMNRDTDRKVVLERLIAQQQSVVVPPKAPERSEGQQAYASAGQELEAARAALKQLELRLKPEHPDVMAARRRIAELEQKADAEAMQQPLSNGGVPTRVLSTAEASRQAQLTEMRAELDNINRRLDASHAEEARLQSIIGSYRSRIEAAPTREADLADLRRDYNTLDTQYQALLKKAEDAKVAVNMERSQISEQFRVVDPARLPERPTSPDRTRMTLMGLGAGLLAGLALAGLLEYRDSSVRTEDDVVVALSLPVVAMVPTMITSIDRRRAVRQRMMVASALVLTVVLAVAAIALRTRLAELWNH